MLISFFIVIRLFQAFQEIAVSIFDFEIPYHFFGTFEVTDCFAAMNYLHDLSICYVFHYVNIRHKWRNKKFIEGYLQLPL
jgi:hypothetical protein